MIEGQLIYSPREISREDSIIIRSTSLAKKIEDKLQEIEHKRLRQVERERRRNLVVSACIATY